MSTTRYTYEHLVTLLDGDHELIAELVEHGVIERRGEDRALVDVDQVLVVRTLVRDLELDWAAIEIILRLQAELARARAKLAELESGDVPAPSR
ncbi:MAG: hypothetical protein H0T79_13015 [Deltaproteobacteria bacterium]|nr:hypothetical protein [Deltaproteobacteria bacterium]